MEDSIINIDECDPFSISSDTDIRNIVDQWKRNDGGTGSRDSKYFDTRTFTRPKKKSFSLAEANGGIFERRLHAPKELDSAAGAEPKIDLQIGGLVTSMQRSFLGDVSPPPNMDSSIGNSLITSSDFSNVNDFFNGADDSLSMTHFKQYRLSDAINDRNFLERLTNYDDSLFTKDNDINNIDGNHLIDTANSSSSTLQNSTDSSNNPSRNDDTFTAAPINGTFDAEAGIDRTFIQVGDEANDTGKRNTTFNCDQINGTDKTFEKPTNLTQSKIWEQTVDLIKDEDLSLCASFTSSDFKLPEIPGLANRILSVKPETPTSNLSSNGLESTPARQNVKKSRQSTSLANISPIENRLTPTTVDKFVDIEIEDEIPEIFLRRIDSKNSSANLIDKERRSLANFEEYEKTLLIVENNDEDEFDDLLNSFSANIRNPLSDKVRQSLDNIKKRHSLIGVEKQQEDELSREKSPKTGKYSMNDRNRTIESHNNSGMASSTSSIGSGTCERLLRRSRVYDDALSISSIQAESDNLNSTVVVAHDQQTSDEELNRKNLSHLDHDVNRKTDENEMIYKGDETISKGSRTPKNRDRFKTIRIFKKPPEDAVQVPDTDEIYYQASESIEHEVLPVKIVPEVIAARAHNSPFKVSQGNMTPDKKAINSMTYKKSALIRPKQLLGGIPKREMYAKSSSHEMLSSDDHMNLETTFIQPKAVTPLKSPMGFKSKSVHNLMGTRNVQNNTSFDRTLNAAAQPSTSTNTFRMPTARAIPAMRQKTSIVANQSRGLLRPSSGYYGYASRRTDSDTESGRFSSTNSLSSGSSKSSLSRGETPETQTAATENRNETFVQPSNVSAARMSLAGSTSKLAQPRLSLLRPPTQIRRSGLPRPTLTSTKR